MMAVCCCPPLLAELPAVAFSANGKKSKTRQRIDLQPEHWREWKRTS